MSEKKIKTPIKSIRAYCLDCSGNSSTEVRECPVVDCPLYPYRLGKSPNRKKREFSEEEKKELAERLKKSRNQ